MEHQYLSDIFNTATWSYLLSAFFLFFPSDLNERANKLNAGGFYGGNVSAVCFFKFKEFVGECEIGWENELLETVIVNGTEAQLWCSAFLAIFSFFSMVFFDTKYKNCSEWVQSCFRNISYWLIFIFMCLNQVFVICVCAAMSDEHNGQQLSFVFWFMIKELTHLKFGYYTMISAALGVLFGHASLSTCSLVKIVMIKTRVDGLHLYAAAARIEEEQLYRRMTRRQIRNLRNRYNQ